jgi:hypothetical protein
LTQFPGKNERAAGKSFLYVDETPRCKYEYFTYFVQESWDFGRNHCLYPPEPLKISKNHPGGYFLNHEGGSISDIRGLYTRPGYETSFYVILVGESRDINLSQKYEMTVYQSPGSQVTHPQQNTIFLIYSNKTISQRRLWTLTIS